MSRKPDTTIDCVFVQYTLVLIDPKIRGPGLPCPPPCTHLNASLQCFVWDCELQLPALKAAVNIFGSVLHHRTFAVCGG